MQIFQFIEEKVLLLFAQLFKIQSNWLWEVLSISISITIILLLAWSVKKMSKKKRYKREKGLKRFLRKALYFMTIATTMFFIFSTIVHTSVITYIASTDYKLSDFSLEENQLNQEFLNVDIYDQEGNKVYTIINNGVNRETVTLDEIPDYLQNAFVSVEDKTFYQHSGISVRGYMRAVYYKLTKPSESMHGGSTLTQQLVKNVKGDIYNRNVLHKYQEALLSIVIENKYSKDEILEMYMNQIFLGTGSGNIHGVGTASKHYFSKHVSELTLAESAFLAGLAQAPSAYTKDLELGNQRKNTVLNVMQTNEYITANQATKAKQKTIKFRTKQVEQSAIAAYADYVLKEAKEMYGIDEESMKHKGFDIYTNLNTELQKNMHEAVEGFTFQDDRKEALVQVGMAAVDSNKGEIIALYGGRDYIRGYRNRSYDRFQPGSLLKPLIVFGPAFETGRWDAFSEVKDELRDFNGYKPKNAGDVYEGNISVERALIRSANIPTVSVLSEIGVQTGIDTLVKLGIPVEKEDNQLHIALGGMEKGVTPIEMAQSYATFQNFGYFEPAYAIKYIQDKNGKYISNIREKGKGIDIYSAENAYHMTEILQKVITDKSGTGGNAKIGRPVAGKTGTAEEVGTSGNRASWFVGYTPEISLSVHLGFDEPSNKQYLTTSGGDEPAKLFAQIMKKTLSNNLVSEFQKPTDVISLSEGPLLTKVHKVRLNYNKEEQHVEIEWDEVNTSGGVIYKVYKIGKEGQEIELGSTKETIFYDTELPIKSALLADPDKTDWENNWLEILSTYWKNGVTSIGDSLWKKHSYYVIATYGDKASEPSKVKWILAPKLKEVKE